VSTLQPVSIKVNGEPRLVAEGLTIVDLLAELGLRPDRVAVELNRAIVKQPSWGATRIPAGAELEIVQFVGGG
jgi:thiamine biosynthesis protein ThiS